MTPEEMKAAIQEGVKNLETQFAKQGELSKEQIEKVANETKTSVEALTQKLEEYGIAIKELKNGNGYKVKTLNDILAENKKGIQDAIAAKSSHTFTVQKGLISGSSLTNGTIALRDTEIGRPAIRSTVIVPTLMQMVLPAGYGGKVTYIDQISETRGAAPRLEGAARGESAIAWQEYTESMKNLGDFIPVTEESMMDLQFIETEINNLLENNMRLLEDSQAWNGDGIGANIKGIYTYATAFNAGAYAGNKFDNPSLLELISVLQNQIMVGKESKYMANRIYMNPNDLQKLRFAKDNDGAYLNPVWAYNGMTLPGLVESSIVTQGTMLVGDTNWVRWYTGQGYTIETGRINDDFVKGKVAIRASKRAFNLVRNVDAGCLLKVTNIDAALAAIKIPVA